MVSGAGLPTILFLCVENSNRSQMAEAFARLHGAGYVDAFSAGSRPSGGVNPKAVAAMRERAYDLTAHRSKSLDDFENVVFDVAVTLGCGDACPLHRARRLIEWDIPDPKHLTPEEFNRVRDLIEDKVKALIDELTSRRAGNPGGPASRSAP